MVSVVHPPLWEGEVSAVATMRNTTYLVIPVIPGLCDDGLEGGELFVGHIEGTEKVLLEEGGTGKGKEEGGGKRLPP